LMELQEIIRTAMIIILSTVGLAFFGIFFGLIYKGVDRKVSAHMQGRIGPPIRQPFRDVGKLFTKENIIPENAIPWVFFVFGDLILILYLLMIPSLALVIGGFASGSPYATVGAQREMATMIAYEFPLAIIIITIAWKLGSYAAGGLGVENAFTLTAIAANPVWNAVGPLGFLGLILLLVVLIIVTPAELSKIPFDAPEAETEIGGGLLVEYSGRNLAMFYLTDAVKTVVMASIIVALFFPYNLSPLFGLESYPAYIIDFIFFLIKILIIIIFSVTLIRVAVARLKIDQIVYTYWVPLTLIALVGLICIMWDGTMMETYGWPKIAEIIGII